MNPSDRRASPPAGLKKRGLPGERTSRPVDKNAPGGYIGRFFCRQGAPMARLTNPSDTLDQLAHRGVVLIRVVIR